MTKAGDWVDPSKVTDNSNRKGEWEVYDSGDPSGSTNIPRRIFKSPSGLDELSLSVRRHELWHVAWSPDNPPTGRNAKIRISLEDARVNLGLGHAGMPFKIGRELAKQIAENVSRYSGVDKLLGALETVGSDAEEYVRLDPECDDIIAAVRGEYNRLRAKERRQGWNRPVVSETVMDKLTKFVSKYLLDKACREAPVPPAPGPTVPAPGSPGSPGSPMSSKEQRKELSKSITRKLRHAATGRVTQAARNAVPATDSTVPEVIRGTQQHSATSYEEGGVLFWEPSRSKMFGVNKFGRKRSRRSEMGDVFLYPERFFTDGKLFRQKIPSGNGGGSIMVDYSGSMTIDPAAVQRMCNLTPRRTQVWAYNGNYVRGRWAALKRRSPNGEILQLIRENLHRDYRGMIRCLAKNGDIADAEAFKRLTGGNEVDQEALEFLATLPKPRIWVSDGQVCGGAVWNDYRIGNATMRQNRLIHNCAELCELHDIIWIKTIQGAIELLQDSVSPHPSEFTPYSFEEVEHLYIPASLRLY